MNIKKTDEVRINPKPHFLFRVSACKKTHLDRLEKINNPGAAFL
ncbi:hypothetical protein MKS87_19620 [Bacillus subtilis]|nr:hypothetical protein [Bacillus subtilis]MBG9459951.1 hypothetical protein [Bacillus subtilis]MBG9490625.1 hypothetical protein [Bacillus subtilis]MBG9572260.1 hypothetical protein [Bacillus subtilis]MBR9949910.1 hypothetical protein [Bacillus subtilis]UML52495.1 hypothetical protein MKS87_19620 [Bacillus subtilis]